MKSFGHKQIREAKAHAAAGGQALHIWQPGPAGYPGAPAVFSRAAGQGKQWGHLFDQDLGRLLSTVRRLGVHCVVVGKKGQVGQHVDLCGRPLQRAIARTSNEGTGDL